MKYNTKEKNLTGGEKIALCRKRAELTQAELADMIGVSKATVSNYETGKAIPDVVTLKRLVNLLGISYTDFIKQPKSAVLLKCYAEPILPDSKEECCIWSGFFEFYGCNPLEYFCIRNGEEIFLVKNYDNKEICSDRVVVKTKGNEDFRVGEYHDGEFFMGGEMIEPDIVLGSVITKIDDAVIINE